MAVPNVAVVIPTHNRKTKVIRCVTSLLAQSYSQYQVVVVDDASAEPVSPDWFPSDPRILILTNPANRRQAASRNRAIRTVPADLYVLLDDDCYVVDSDWIQRHVALHDRFPGSLIGGRITHATKSLWGKARAALSRDGIQYGNFLQTMNLSFSSSVFQSLEGFDESLGELEDVDFSQRAKRLEIALIYSGEAPIVHEFDESFRAILRRNHQYGRWTVPVRKGRRYDGHWVLPGSFFSSLLYYLPLSCASTLVQVGQAARYRPVALLFCPVIFVYTLFHTAGMIRYYWDRRVSNA